MWKNYLVLHTLISTKMWITFIKIFDYLVDFRYNLGIKMEFLPKFKLKIPTYQLFHITYY